MAKNEYVSMRGKVVDLELLKKANELAPAIGNAKVNARGDELGPGGKIIRSREDIIKDYYKTNPNRVIQESSKKVESTNTVQTDSVVISTPSVLATDLSDDEKKIFEEDDWIEDSTGNFVKKEKTSKKSKTE
jgi:hypothetical protein